ncbi:MAG: hypothetical protein LUQ25_09375 [Methanoregulaceae archaeon]|nr:hypothetical protein [Methanoregulaceae archaeon]
MKHTNFACTVLALLAVMLAVTGIAAADRAVNATAETAGITSDTHIECIGTVMTSSSLSGQIGTGDLNPPLGDAEAIGTVGYNERTMAVDGETSYTAHMGFDSSNKIADKNNFESQRIIAFDGSKGSGMGRMTSSESVMIDMVGKAADTASTLLCPFGADSSEYSPAFCSVVKAGSDLDLYVGSVATQSSARVISATGDVPVALGYSINLRGLNDGEPADGSAKAYMRAHIQDARGNSTDKSSDIQYEEESSASGKIYVFSKDMGYNSGMRRV